MAHHRQDQDEMGGQHDQRHIKFGQHTDTRGQNFRRRDIRRANRRRSVRGQITFANPIVGVITMDRLLRESEVIFGVPDVSYPSPRTIEPRPAGDQRRGFDSLTLAADRRTLLIELQENPGHLDQVRVLIETGN